MQFADGRPAGAGLKIEIGRIVNPTRKFEAGMPPRKIIEFLIDVGLPPRAHIWKGGGVRGVIRPPNVTENASMTPNNFKKLP